MPLDYHPWRGNPEARRDVVGSVKVNITTAKTITGHGGSSIFDLKYTCRNNFCSEKIGGK